MCDWDNLRLNILDIIFFYAGIIGELLKIR